MSEVEIRIDDKIANTIASKLRSIKGEATSADTAIERLKASLNIGNSAGLLKAANDSVKLKSALADASRMTASFVGETSKLEGRMTRMARGFQQWTARVRENSKALLENSRNVRASSGHMGQLITMIGAYAGVHAFVDVANDAQRLNNQLRTITNSTAEYNKLQADLFNLAEKTRTGIEETTSLYVNFSKVLKSVGISQSEMFRMVETLNKGFQVAGKSAAEASGSTRQLMQALQSGVLRGDEFNSIMEGMPIEILESMARAAGVSVEKLRAMAEQGALTRDVIRKGLGGAAIAIDDLFARTTPTIENAFTSMRNHAIKFFQENTQGGQMLAQVIYFIGQNLNILIPLVVSLAAAWALVKVVQIVKEFYDLIKVTGAWILVNGGAIISIGLWVAAVLLAVGAAVALARIIAYMTGQGDQFDAWLEDSVVQVVNYGKSLADAFGDTAKEAVTEFTKTMDKAKTSLNPQIPDAAKAATSSIKEIGTSSKTAADQATSSIKRIVSSLDTLIWKMQAGEAQARKLYAALEAKGGSSGSFQTLNMGNSKPAYPGGSIQNITGKGVAGFATGGSFMVGGQPGRDTNPVGFMATKGEKVTVQTKAQQRAEKQGHYAAKGDTTIYFNVYTNDADSFRRSRSQTAADFARIVGNG